VAQTLQLINAGRLPFWQGAQTLPTREKLAQYELLPRTDVRPLTEAYCFLRDVKHRLQMEDNRQTHTIPVSPAARERLAGLMGFASWEDFEAARKQHAGAVRRVDDRLLKADGHHFASHRPAQEVS
jgi:glutamate-ammonia-ligase adenylyltransferase